MRGGPLPKPELNKKARKQLEVSDAHQARARQTDSVIAASNLLKRLGYDHPEIGELLEMASYLAEGD